MRDRAALGIDQPHEAARQRRLARAGFADDAERRALRQGQRDVLDRMGDALAAAEEAARAIGLRDMLDRQDRRRRRASRGGGAFERRHGRDELLRVGVLRGGQHLVGRALLDDAAPGCITATRSAISATTPKSWVMNSTAVPLRFCRSRISFEDLRLGGDVERRGRLVGDQQPWDRARVPSRSWRAGAGRRRVRADRPLAAATGSGMRTSSSSACTCACDLGLRRASVWPRTSRRSGRRWCAAGSAPSSAPGRSWRCRRRAPCASRPRRGRAEVAALEQDRARRRSSTPSAVAASRHWRSSTCRSRIRRRRRGFRWPRASSETSLIAWRAVGILRQPDARRFPGRGSRSLGPSASG